MATRVVLALDGDAKTRTSKYADGTHVATAYIVEGIGDGDDASAVTEFEALLATGQLSVIRE